MGLRNIIKCCKQLLNNVLGPPFNPLGGPLWSSFGQFQYCSWMISNSNQEPLKPRNRLMMTSPSRISAIQYMHNVRKTKHGNCKSSPFLLFPKCEAKELFKFKNNTVIQLFIQSFKSNLFNGQNHYFSCQFVSLSKQLYILYIAV